MATDESNTTTEGTGVNVGIREPNGQRFSIGDIGDFIGNRGRRRRGSDNAESTDGTSGTTQAYDSSEPVRQTVTRRKKTAPPDKAALKAAADFGTGLVQQVGVMRYGAPNAVMTPQERTMISQGIEGTLSNLPGEVSKQISAWSAPVMLAMGLMMYASRCSTYEPARRANIAESQRAAAASAVLQAEQITRQSAPAETVQNGVYNVPTPNAEHRDATPNIDVIRGVMES